jgi:hypothetical protein
MFGHKRIQVHSVSRIIGSLGIAKIHVLPEHRRIIGFMTGKQFSHAENTRLQCSTYGLQYTETCSISWLYIILYLIIHTTQAYNMLGIIVQTIYFM